MGDVIYRCCASNWSSPTLPPPHLLGHRNVELLHGDPWWNLSMLPWWNLESFCVGQNKEERREE